MRETLDRMRSRSTRFSDVPDFSVDVPRRTVFGNSVEEATRVNLRKSKYEYSDAVYNSKPGYTLYEENTRDVKRTNPDELLMIRPQVNQSWFPQANSSPNVPVFNTYTTSVTVPTTGENSHCRGAGCSNGQHKKAVETNPVFGGSYGKTCN